VGKKSDNERALLAAVAADPEDDIVRLAYADWLDERGDARSADRAAFIRAQIEAEGDLDALSAWERVDEEDRRFWADSERRKYGYSPPTARVGRRKPRPVPPTAFDRGQELLGRYEDEWLKPFAKWLQRYNESPSYENMESNFRRGFPHRFTVPAESFRKHGAKFFGLAPVRELWFPGGRWFPAGSEYARLAEVPALARLRSLDLRDNAIAPGESFEAYEKMLLSPHLAGLRVLTLEGPVEGGPGFGGLRALLGRHHLTNLETLVFSSQTSEDFVRAFASSANFSRLTRLEVYFCDIGPETAHVLATAPGLAALRMLDLRNCSIPPRAKRALEERFGAGVRFRKV